MPKTLPKKSASRRTSARELVFGDLWEFDPAPETADPKLSLGPPLRCACSKVTLRIHSDHDTAS